MKALPAALAAFCVAAAIVVAALCGIPGTLQPESALTKTFGELHQPWQDQPAVRSSGHATAPTVRLSPAPGTEPRVKPGVAAESPRSLQPAATASASHHIIVLRI